jgi:DNA repair protein RadA/Sms
MSKFIWVCRNCGHETNGYFGQCSSCGAWGTLEKETIIKTKTKATGVKHSLFVNSEDEILRLSEIGEDSILRLNTGSEEFNRVLGGGIVPASVNLIGGQPGIGKSTLLLQLAFYFSLKKLKVLYVSAEESSTQLKMRAKRLNSKGGCYETDHGIPRKISSNTEHAKQKSVSYEGRVAERTSSRLRRTNDRNVRVISSDAEDASHVSGSYPSKQKYKLDLSSLHEDHEDDENAEIGVPLHAHEENILVYTESNLEKILEAIKNSEANLIIVDSIQALYNPNLDSVPGNVSQIKECCSNLTRIAKTFNVPIFIVGHINKDGDIAGPKILEHMVDTVLQFEMIKDESLRILRSIKNRFGSTDELAVFEMRENGLSDVSDPSQIFLNQRAGGIVTVIKEGRRALLVEVQSLVIYSDQHNPRRMANGIDFTRLHQILAIMEKYLKIPMGKQDVYVNVAGGLSIKEPASDLAIALSMLEKPDSSANDFIALGELGLGGEIRQVTNIELRLKEAQKLGFTKAIIPTLAPELKINLIQLKIEIIEVSNIQEAATAFKFTKHSSSYQERVIERNSSSPRRTNDRSVLKQSTEKCLK